DGIRDFHVTGVQTCALPILVATSTDYFADHDTASVVQHFWSLSIQGQFYLLWPLLIAVVALLVRRAGWSLRRTVFAVLVVVFARSDERRVGKVMYSSGSAGE